MLVNIVEPVNLPKDVISAPVRFSSIYCGDCASWHPFNLARSVGIVFIGIVKDGERYVLSIACLPEGPEHEKLKGEMIKGAP